MGVPERCPDCATMHERMTHAEREAVDRDAWVRAFNSLEKAVTNTLDDDHPGDLSYLESAHRAALRDVGPRAVAPAPPIYLICGSRDLGEHTARVHGLIASDLANLPDSSVVIAGGARGVDTMAADLATARGLHVAVVKPNWPRFGKAAGVRRNVAMLALKPIAVLAYWDGRSPGTKTTIDLARERGVWVEVRWPEGR
jgi:hypothetical protein